MDLRLETRKIAPHATIGVVLQQSANVRATAHSVYGQVEKRPFAVLATVDGRVSVFDMSGALLEPDRLNPSLRALIAEFRATSDQPKTNPTA